MTQKKLRLGAFMRPVSIHTAAWRYPGGTPDANFNLKALVQYAQTLERGKFDAFFMADHLAVLNMPMDALKRSATVTSFDPLTLLPALAMATKHLGLIATASSTFEPAYTIARRFASLDHISGGRAGWNLVTTSNPDSARNFGHVAFAVDDIYAICAKLAAGGVVINRPPRDGHMAFVRSPDAISVELLQKGAPLTPREPWLSMASTGAW